ncbi:MAG: nuclear transport factor 2 family protein [Candidatus Palauibacterales bacterium]|nr:nuclear transport factor 2 family protein [Candidatus Palauibacterales bacterium]MDP2482375.1 nuclear transport factor 2 family protein [Candidatus Palauibacterales bacterium]
MGRVLTALAVLTWASCAKQQSPAAFVERYLELHRSRDVDALLALHTADAEFVIPGQEPLRGTAALRDLFEWDAVLGSELVMSGIRSDADTILIDSVIERNKWFQALGLVEVRHRAGTRIVLRDGRIAATYPAAFDDETQRRLMDRFQPLLRWLGEHRREALDQLLPGGKFRYDAATARLWLEVLAEWNTSRRPDG